MDPCSIFQTELALHRRRRRNTQCRTEGRDCPLRASSRMHELVFVPHRMLPDLRVVSTHLSMCLQRRFRSSQWQRRGQELLEATKGACVRKRQDAPVARAKTVIRVRVCVWVDVRAGTLKATTTACVGSDDSGWQAKRRFFLSNPPSSHTSSRWHSRDPTPPRPKHSTRATMAYSSMECRRRRETKYTSQHS